MKIDNRDFLFDDSLYAVKNTIAPELAIKAMDKESGSLGFAFSNSVEGTYYNSYDTTEKQIYDFTINAIITHYNDAPVFQMYLRPNPESFPNPLTLTVTNVNPIYIEGTFSGTLSLGGIKSDIRNGKFKVPFKR